MKKESEKFADEIEHILLVMMFRIMVLYHDKLSSLPVEKEKEIRQEMGNELNELACEISNVCGKFYTEVATPDDAI